MFRQGREMHEAPGPVLKMVTGKSRKTNTSCLSFSSLRQLTEARGQKQGIRSRTGANRLATKLHITLPAKNKNY